MFRPPLMLLAVCTALWAPLTTSAQTPCDNKTWGKNRDTINCDYHPVYGWIVRGSAPTAPVQPNQPAAVPQRPSPQEFATTEAAKEKDQAAAATRLRASVAEFESVFARGAARDYGRYLQEQRELGRRLYPRENPGLTPDEWGAHLVRLGVAEFELARVLGFSESNSTMGYLFVADNLGFPDAVFVMAQIVRMSPTLVAETQAMGAAGLLSGLEKSIVQRLTGALDGMQQRVLRRERERANGQVRAPVMSPPINLLQRDAMSGLAAYATEVGMAVEAGPPAWPVRNEAMAARLYHAAADRGHAQAQYRLGRMFASGRGGLVRDELEAARLYRLAADQGDTGARNELGVMIQLGQGGLEKNDTEAVRLYRLAADQGNPYARSNLAAMYQQGRGGLETDLTEAARLFRLAADQGIPAAQNALGRMYEQGSGGLPKDTTEALKWYRAAAMQGWQPAKVALARLGAR